MASFSSSCLLQAIVVLSLATLALGQGLTPSFYDKVCPQALQTIRRVVNDAVRRERRMGASLLRMHFHDCFVNGCDASILLDQTSTIDSEKNARPNKNSVRGFEVIDRIKSEVDKACNGLSVVSCADILTVAARDSVVALGGPTWQVPLGRRDSTTASRTLANNNLPAPSLDLQGLINNFNNQGLDVKDLVVLSGGHTIGFAQCQFFRPRIYNETNNIDPQFALLRQRNCPVSGRNTSLSPLDFTPARFDTNYFNNLVQKKGLLHSDQQLFGNGGQTDDLVKTYSMNRIAFGQDFANSMIKMGNIKPLTGTNGEIRSNCRKVNGN